MLSQVLLVVTVLLSAAETTQPRIDATFQIVVHRSNGLTAIRRDELSALFMRRRKSWRDGSEIRPVEPPSRSRVREQFSRAVHGKSVAYVTRYWHRVIFAGRGVPPEELPSDAAVLEYVKTHRGAIGYIARETPVGDGVKAIAVTP
jgi:ABC-type phosphate transport system substrate-binding protein